MAFERLYKEIGPVLFTADGLNNGIITITTTDCFKVKMFVVIESDTITHSRFQIKRVLSETQMIIGPENKSINAHSDMSLYTLLDNPRITAPDQPRPDISNIDYERAVYEEEPTVAKRVFNVDKYGNPYTDTNPFPVNLGSTTISADLSVQLTREDNDPAAGDIHDAVRIGNQDYELAFKPDCETGKAEARVVDTLHCGGLNKIITLTGAPMEVKVGATAKADRKTVFMRPLTGKARWGFLNTITDDDTTTGGDPLFKRQPAEISAESSTSVYIVGPAGVKVFVAEA